MKGTFTRIFIGLVFSFLLLQANSQVLTQDLRLLLKKNAVKLGITVADATDAVITDSYTDSSSGISFVYLQQASRQIKVYNCIISAAFKNGSFLYSSGAFVNNIGTKTAVTAPAITVLEAVRATARHLHLDENTAASIRTNLFDTEKKYLVAAPSISKRDIEVTLVWQPSGDKLNVQLVWNVNIDQINSADWFNVRIDALTGAFVQKDNWTVDESIPYPTQASATGLPRYLLPEPAKDKRSKSQGQAASPATFLNAPPPTTTSATYRVIQFPAESPSHAGFTNHLNPWLLAGAVNNATTLGWHFDNVNNYDITRGNNVFAFLDRRRNDAPDPAINWPDTSSTPSPTLNFIHNIATTVQPFQNVENKKVAIDNLFYWNNLMHDVTYQYGFTELAGNFQASNISRGGAGADQVMANAQDSLGYNNANFSTPVDGTSGKMQMYTWSTSPKFSVDDPPAIAGIYPATENSFSAPNKLIDRGPVTALAALYNDNAAGTVHTGCDSLVPYNAASLNGKIVLIDAGGCTFISKVKKAQNAGAVAVLLYYPTLLGLGGTDATVTIPCISITTAVANSIITQLAGNKPVTITLATGIYKDGDLDNGIICHEYGHGISNRLTGGPANSSCLGNAEQGGEGWSDYFALMMTTNWATAALTDGSLPRPVGTYAINQPVNGSGIRRYPYTTNMAVNPLTYANMAASTEVHNTGEIWCAALWDMTWNIIQQQNSITTNLYNSAGPGGNVIAMNLVMMGLKLQPCGPGFLDARNAILAADSILYNYAHKCAIWNAFARRGMGSSASQGLATSATDQVQAFDLPGSVRIAKPSVVSVSAGTQLVITQPAVCECQAVTGFVLRDTIPAGFTYVSSAPAGTLSGNVLSFPATSFTATETKNFSINLLAPATGCGIDSVIYDNREVSTTGGLVSSGTPGWASSTAKSYSPANSWLGGESATSSVTSLTSGSVAATASQNLSILSFWHYFNTEKTFDGGVVEYTTDGTTWLDASSFFVKNAYNTSMDGSTILSGRKAFSGSNSFFTESLLNLSSLGAVPVGIRFRMTSDDGTTGEGWYVDDISRLNGCGGILKVGGYNSSSSRIDSSVYPIFVTQQSLPLNLLWFYANPVGSQVVLDWKTVAEWNVRDFGIEYSTNGTTWTSLGTVAAANGSANSYNFIHDNPVKGSNFYRIKMTDADGKFTYTAVRQIIKGGRNEPLVVLIPNPVTRQATLYLSTDLNARTLRIFNAAGALVKQQAIANGTRQVAINTDDLTAGIYMLETSGGSQKQMLRMLVRH